MDTDSCYVVASQRNHRQRNGSGCMIYIRDAILVGVNRVPDPDCASSEIRRFFSLSMHSGLPLPHYHAHKQPSDKWSTFGCKCETILTLARRASAFADRCRRTQPTGANQYGVRVSRRTRV